MIWFQILLRDIGLDIATIDKNVLPRILRRRSGPSHLIVPFFWALELRVDVDYNATVVKHAMMNDLADRKFRFRGGHQDFSHSALSNCCVLYTC